VRGFLAFGIKDAFTAELESYAAEWQPDPNLSHLLPVDYHITIKFLSEFSSLRFLQCLPEICNLGNPPPHAFRAGAVAIWPSVVALECEPSKEMRDWHGEVNGLLERKGFLQERHPTFHPHITLARRKENEKHGELQRFLLERGKEFAGRMIPVEAPALWRSQPDGMGRRHLPYLSPLYKKIFPEEIA